MEIIEEIIRDIREQKMRLNIMGNQIDYLIEEVRKLKRSSD
jgi:uncharacterized coiled-coil protein SlyX